MLVDQSFATLHRSRLLKLVATLGLAASLASFGIGACADSLPVEPTARSAPEPALARFPTEEEYAEMPAEFRQKPGILSYRVDAWFSGGRAHGSAHMRYLANYGEIVVPVTLLYNNAEVTRTTGYAELASFLPMERDLYATASMGVTGSCGHTVNATGIFSIHNQFPLKTGWFSWGHEKASGSDSESQPACACSAGVKQVDYDPYDPASGTGECGTGGTSPGSGTQYRPGDYTGGETVSWTTGVGNGGESVCGAAAMVDYVCIDTWNETTQSWEQWGCGYVTTC